MTHRIAVLPGDGIGRVVMEESLDILEGMALPLSLYEGDIGWEFWKKEGTAVPERTWTLLEECDVALLGATSSFPYREALEALDPRFQNRPYVSPLVQIRQRLELFANVRPIFPLLPSKRPFSFTILRENTEGLYAGYDDHPTPQGLFDLIKPKGGFPQDIACSLRVQTREGLLRLFEFAVKYAKEKNLKRIVLADKPNVLRQSSHFVRELLESVAAQHSDIDFSVQNVDALALWMLRRPENYELVIAENMFGDILSHAAASLMGGLGFAPSANIGKTFAYFAWKWHSHGYSFLCSSFCHVPYHRPYAVPRL